MADPDVMRFASAVRRLVGAVPSLANVEREINQSWWLSLCDRFSIEEIEYGLRRLGETWTEIGRPRLSDGIAACELAKKNLAYRIEGKAMRLLDDPDKLEHERMLEQEDEELFPRNADDVAMWDKLISKLFEFAPPCTAEQMVERMKNYNGDSRWRLLPKTDSNKTKCKEEMKALGINGDDPKKLDAFWEAEHRWWRMIAG